MGIRDIYPAVVIEIIVAVIRLRGKDEYYEQPDVVTGQLEVVVKIAPQSLQTGVTLRSFG
jgi:hypothetical protein